MDEQTKPAPEISENELVMPNKSLAQSHPDAAHHNRVGVVLVLLIVLLVLILGGLYLWFSVAYTEPATTPAPAERVVPEMPNEPEMPNAEAAVQQLNTVSTSNEIDAIEADLEATNLNELDAELNAIDAELDAAM